MNDLENDRQEEQFDIFVTLMATRAYIVEKEDVKTLEVEHFFNDNQPEEADVLFAWEKYIVFLEKDPVYQENNNDDRIKLITEVLKKISIVLNIDIDISHITEGCHTDIPIENFEEVQMSIRQEMMKLLQNKSL